MRLSNVLDGFASVFAWGTGFGANARAYPDVRGGFARDRQKLRADVRRVGNDLRAGLETHGKPVLKRAGQKRPG